jgi:hypothetical protein
MFFFASLWELDIFLKLFDPITCAGTEQEKTVVKRGLFDRIKKDFTLEEHC